MANNTAKYCDVKTATGKTTSFYLNGGVGLLLFICVSMHLVI